jgi:hypothetical protein
MIWPVAKRGRPRQRHVPDILSIPAEDMLANAKWRTISWRTGTKGKLKARFVAVRVRVADGPPQRIRDKGQQHLPGDEAWLIGELKKRWFDVMSTKFAANTFERIKTVLREREYRADFIREAVEREIERREAVQKRQPRRKQGRGP